MNLLSSNIFRAAAVAIALPLLGVSATSTVNVTGGTVNYSPGTTQSGTSGEAIFVGADEYYLSSSYNYGTNAAGGTTVTFLPTVTYIGAAPSTSADTVSFNLLAAIYDSGAANWDGTYSEKIPFVLSSGVSATGELMVYGSGAPQGVGLVSDGPGGTYAGSTISKSLSGINGPTLNYNFDYTFSFAKGSVDGSYGSSPASTSATPEPATIIPAALSLAGFALVAVRRRKK